jgi:hypothetical protein
VSRPSKWKLRERLIDHLEVGEWPNAIRPFAFVGEFFSRGFQVGRRVPESNDAEGRGHTSRHPIAARYYRNSVGGTGQMSGGVSGRVAGRNAAVKG